MTHSAFRNLHSEIRDSAIRNPQSEIERDADEILAITVASINTARRRNKKSDPVTDK